MLEFDLKKYQIFFFVAWLAILASILNFGWSATWSALAVPTVFPEFADMRTVQGALYSLNEGFNPQINNPGDPWGRSMNYPSIWISISELFNLQIELHFKIFVSLMVLLFLGCCFLMLRQYPSIILLILCFSGATLLAVERGNNDILIFSLLYFSAIASGRLYIFILLIATLLKIFPVLAFPAFIRSYKTFLLMMLVAAISMIILLPEIVNIRNGTPISAKLSYGSQSISAAFQRFNYNLPAQYISILVLFSTLVTWRVKFFCKRFTFTEPDSRAKQMFLIGSCVYVGTFVLSSNFDYRLVFLILCVPYVMNANDRYLRILTSLSLICAFNQLPLILVFGPIGAGFNILSKVLLTIFCSVVILIELRARLLIIFKSND